MDAPMNKRPTFQNGMQKKLQKARIHQNIANIIKCEQKKTNFLKCK